MESKIFVCLFVLAITLHRDQARYASNWKSLDSRPLPSWYDQGKVGIFIHWGVFSVPSYRSEWFWWYWKGAKKPEVVKFMRDNYPPGFTYPDFASQFRAELFDPVQWADMFNASGAQYVVLTTKHHEGYCMWPSQFSWNWNAGDVGPKRDLVGDLARAIRGRTKLRFGLYHSMFEWFNPLYLNDSAAKFKTDLFVRRKTLPELYELVTKYRPDIVWSDGDAGPDWYWRSTEFLAWLYNESPVRDSVVVNDRWGTGTACKHGGYYTCQDRYNPGRLVNHKWENCLTLDKKSWGYRRESQLGDYMTIQELLQQLVSTVSCGGNLLINIGPSHDGRIHPIFEERLRQLGAWLQVNGEAIYGTKPWHHQNDTVTRDVWYTSSNTTKNDDVVATTVVYATFLTWPKQNKLFLGSVKANSNTMATTPQLTLLGDNTPLKFDASSKKGLLVYLPFDSVVGQRFSAYSIRMTGIEPL